MTQVNNMKKMI